MTTKLYLDIRGKSPADEQTEYPVKIAINHRGSSSYIATSVKVRRDQWNAKLGQIVEHPFKARLNLALAEKKLHIDKCIEELRSEGALHGATASGIKEAVERYYRTDNDGGGRDKVRVAEVLDKYARGKDKARTVESLWGTAQKVRAFAPDATFWDITPAWLADFDGWLARTNPSANSRAVHMRNVKTAFNWALGEGWTSAPYPFRRFKIKREPTADRSLTREELRQLFSAPVTPVQEKYRDILLLSFLMCGINLADLMALPAPRNGKVDFKRIKTGQPVGMSLQEEAARVAKKYKGNYGLFVNFGEKCGNHKNLLHRINDQLKRIGQVYNPHTREWEGESLFPDLTYYSARVSWASLAADLDVPERTIGAALGHSTSKSVTSIYIRVDMRKKVDEANRKVIDAVFGK